MTKREKWNPKVYLGKKRKYIPLPGYRNISRLYVWDEQVKEHRPPETGKAYMARRWESDKGKKVRVTKYFENLRLATGWQQKLVPDEKPSEKPEDLGPTMSEVIEKWKMHCYGSLSLGSRVAYDSGLKHMEPLLAMPINSITRDTLDTWVKNLKPRSAGGKKGRLRHDFKQIVALLKTILLHYQEEEDDKDFRMPLRERHFRMAAVPLYRKEEQEKNIRPEEFKLFHAALGLGLDPVAMQNIATLQFEHTRRISEVLDLEWKDIDLDFARPEKSVIKFQRHVIFNTPKGVTPFTEPGLKNTDKVEHALTPASYQVLASLWRPGISGRIFCRPKDGSFFNYQAVRRRYNAALKRAKLPYSATHILRHGGSSKTYDETGDLEIAKQQLGNTSIISILTYAKRNPRALTAHTQKKWSQMVATGPGGDENSVKSAT